MEQTPDLTQILRLAQSPAGKQLLQLLQRQGGSELQTAANLASQGNYVQARNTLSQFLNTPEAIRLLKELEDIK